MKNFKIVDKNTGKEFWISRSVAVTVIVYFRDVDNNLYVLTEKRGKGCPDFVGYYCLPCGYVDWDETLEQAAIREVYEETGLKLDETHKLNVIGIQSNPKDNKNQNITIRFEVKVRPEEIIDAMLNNEINLNTEERGGEKDEVELFKIFKCPNDLEDMPAFAWNHNELLVDWYYGKRNKN